MYRRLKCSTFVEQILSVEISSQKYSSIHVLYLLGIAYFCTIDTSLMERINFLLDKL